MSYAQSVSCFSAVRLITGKGIRISGCVGVGEGEDPIGHTLIRRSNLTMKTPITCLASKYYEEALCKEIS